MSAPYPLAQLRDVDPEAWLAISTHRSDAVTLEHALAAALMGALDLARTILTTGVHEESVRRALSGEGWPDLRTRPETAAEHVAAVARTSAAFDAALAALKAAGGLPTADGQVVAAYHKASLAVNHARRRAEAAGVVAYTTRAPLPEPTEAPARAGDPYVIVEGGVVQNDPGVPVLDLDVFDSDGALYSSADFECVTDLRGTADSLGLTDLVERCDDWLDEHADLAPAAEVEP